jgi:hypothetical protein
MTNKTTDKPAADEAIDSQTGAIVPMPREGLTPAETYGYPARVSDLIPTPDAWAEYKQVDVETILDTDVILLDCMIFDSQQYEDRRWAIILFRDTMDGDPVTTACGGDVLVRKLEQLKKWTIGGKPANVFPIPGKILLKPSQVRGHQGYYDLV